MPKTRAQKAESVSALAKAFKAGKAAVFADFQGMSVQAVTGLRKKLHAEHVDYVVAKKTLMARAAKDAGYDIDFKAMPGMLGAAIANEDEMAAARIVGEAASQKDATIKLVGGIFEGKPVDKEFVTKLSKLPSKPQLLTQLLWVFNGPIGGFARVLNAYKEEKEKGAPAPKAEAPAPAPAEPAVAEAAPAPAEAAPAPEQPAA
ncbi:MAG TPA: 50S ribosomal protein L10 [Verrucomicrobiae bacterium]|nr:50S ribosomal protein L10 [Verrucomicrobiae bacterium]